MRCVPRQIPRGEFFILRRTSPAALRTSPAGALVQTLLMLGLLGTTLGASAAEAPRPGQTATRLTELSLDELMQIEVPTVYGASKREQKVTDAPSSVTIITADDVKRYGYRTLAEILQSVRGLQVSNDRNYYYLGIRGFSRPGDYNARVLVLVDGHRINDNVYDSGFIGTEFILDVDLISRVEVIRGPGSSLYGNNAFFGVINVVTKKGREFGGPEISGAVASFDSYQGRWTYGQQFKNGVELLLSGSWSDSAGPRRLYFADYDAPETNHGIAEGTDDEDFQSAFANVSYRDFNLQGAFVSREKGIPTGAYETVFNSPRNRTVDERAYLNLKYEHTFFDQLDVMGRAYYDHYLYDGDYLYDYAEPGDPPDLVLNQDETRGDWVGGEFQLRERLEGGHTFTLGAEYREDLRQDQRNFDRQPYDLLFDHAGHSRNWGVYLQAEVAILTNLTLNAGARYDEYDTFGDTANPRIGVIYHPWPKTGVKCLYG